ncbi:formate dehydrogenase [Siccirubricoccus deserti]|uniref:Molybdopterin-dependent oxidoreductase n=1 Tax=Siccirubricoccus deserti TaxID=2013562 RepID=A0A9X0UD93_9PROT|nr:molybdopterin-dependent oxidoreductase [Siccirubricoccus deserti]MBC4015416.1 molybdopterin-dependent oxidoreductase [Siccirubricoccus deserti]GGC41481.1 formate dehydrogenase [Siccirubricoccus deserti]
MAIAEHPSVCTLDCPDTCSLTVGVEAGRIVKVRGSQALPYTAGVICNKVAHHTGAFVHGPGRLHHPLQRVGPRGGDSFRRIGWDEALDIIHARTTEVIDRYGPQAVMPLNYAGPHGLLSYDSMSLRFFHRLGATQLFRRAMCGGVRSEAWVGTYGAVPGVGPEAAAEARLNILWGNNATVTNLHLVRQLGIARRHGGRLAVIDPLRTKVAEQADLHLAIRPGTDVVLGFALAVALEVRGAHDRRFIAEHVAGYAEYMEAARAWPPERAAETCGIPLAQIETLAEWMAEATPLVIAPGNGLERHRNGGSGLRAAIALPALLGKLDARSGVVLGAGNAFPRTPARLHRPDLLPPGTRTLNILDVGRHLESDTLDPPLRALFIYNHNPIVVHPDQNRLKRGLLREEIFTVGVEVAMTESMRFCDIILPAATQFEVDDIYVSYGHPWLQRAAPVIPPLGESLPNTEIFRRLAARFGFDEPCFAADDATLMDEALDPADPRLRGIRPSAVPTTEALRMTAPDGRPLVVFDTIMPATPSGKVELVSDTLAGRWGPEARLPGYRPRTAALPLALISPASDKRISSTLLGAGGAPADNPPLLMHPADAAARGLQAASRVKLWNALGAVILPLRVTDAVPPGVVASEKGTWLASSPTGQTISALVSATDRADLSEGACYNDTAVEVSAA